MKSASEEMDAIPSSGCTAWDREVDQNGEWEIYLTESKPIPRTLTLEECQQYLHVDACPAVP